MTTTAENKIPPGQPLLNDTILQQLPAYNPGLVAVIRSADLKILFVNKPFEHYLGYSNDNLQGEGLFFTDILEHYQLDHLRDQFCRVENDIDARSGYVIYRLKNDKGAYKSFYLYASPITEEGEHGKTYFILLHPDLSKWGMPFTSYDSKELFLEQFDGEHFGTFEWIADIKKTFLSAGVYRIFEVDQSFKELNNANAQRFIHPGDLEWLTRDTLEAIRNGGDLNVEFRIVTGNGTVKLMHCLARVIHNHSGKCVKFAGSIRDITRHRAIQEDLKNKIEELNLSNRELEEFAYAASHDMQEPLRKITTFSDRLSEKYKDVLTGDGSMYLSRMIIAAENMRNLINDLLEFSRISKTKLPFRSINLEDVLRDVKSDLEVALEESGAVINSRNLPGVDGIETQMRQLFTNVIGNAVKFRKASGTPIINIEAEVLSRDESLKLELAPGTTYYKIQVIDNGIGFENEYATRIFQVFQRLHGKSEYPGTGIGLAICKKIVEYHQGIIYAEGLPEEGARFVLILPQHQPQQKAKII